MVRGRAAPQERVSQVQDSGRSASRTTTPPFRRSSPATSPAGGKSSCRYPDLIVIDGGKGQLSAAVEAADTARAGELPIVSLAKREEEVFLPGRSESLRLPRRSPSLRLLQRARDEAHRFGLAYNRKRRTQRTITSELLSIPGVGPTKRRLGCWSGLAAWPGSDRLRSPSSPRCRDFLGPPGGADSGSSEEPDTPSANSPPSFPADITQGLLAVRRAGIL